MIHISERTRLEFGEVTFWKFLTQLNFTSSVVTMKNKR